MKSALKDLETNLEASITRAFDDLRASIYRAMVVQGLAIAIGITVAITLG